MQKWCPFIRKWCRCPLFACWAVDSQIGFMLLLLLLLQLLLLLFCFFVSREIPLFVVQLGCEIQCSAVLLSLPPHRNRFFSAHLRFRKLSAPWYLVVFTVASSVLCKIFHSTQHKRFLRAAVSHGSCCIGSAPFSLGTHAALHKQMHFPPYVYRLADLFWLFFV